LSCKIQNHEWDDEAQEDPDVRKERERLERHEAREFALAVRNLTKYYGTLPAVKNLTFGVKKEECFGLLGKF
jgi:ABC-type glutathione transport system ATPase component